jgi:hypothetical protein
MNFTNIPQIQALLIAWAWIKKYAWILFAITSIVLVYVLFRKGTSSDISSAIEDIKKRHDEEIKAITDANLQRDVAYAANEKKLQQALKLLDEKYTKQLGDLDNQKRMEVDKIIAESGNDPSALADALAKQLDLQVKSL